MVAPIIHLKSNNCLTFRYTSNYFIICPHSHFVLSEQARQKLTDIFDIHHKDNESKLKTFCDYYMGSKDQEVSVTTSIN